MLIWSLYMKHGMIEPRRDYKFPLKVERRECSMLPIIYNLCLVKEALVSTMLYSVRQKDQRHIICRLSGSVIQDGGSDAEYRIVEVVRKCETEDNLQHFKYFGQHHYQGQRRGVYQLAHQMTKKLLYNKLRMTKKLLYGSQTQMLRKAIQNYTIAYRDALLQNIEDKSDKQEIYYNQKEGLLGRKNSEQEVNVVWCELFMSQNRFK